MSSRILIIDDEQEVVEITTQLLLKRGYVIESAPNGEDALLKISENPPDLIITDYRLPGVNGDILVHQLKSDATTKHIPIIMCTAQALMKSPTGGNPRLIKPDDYLIKPFDINELLEKVSALLSG